MSTAPQQSNTPLPGSLFDVPGVPGGSTQWYDNYEPSQDVVNTLSATNEVGLVGLQNFEQVDVVTDWEMALDMDQTYTAGTGQTLTVSDYAPHNAVQQTQIKIQNTWNSVDVESGIDLFIFNLIRPNNKRNNSLNLARPQNWPVQEASGNGAVTTNLVQDNLNQATWSTSTTDYNLIYRLPASQWFDTFFPLDINGQPQGPATPALVSPIYLGGTTRHIIPKVKIAPGFTGQLDDGPVNTTTLTGTSDTASTYTGSVSATFRRRAIFGANPAVLPPVYPWQIRWKTDRFSISGKSKATILIPEDAGQVLSWYIRLWDPSANGGLGAPIDITALNSIQYVYGSGLSRFNGTPAESQRNWVKQHSFLLPKGVFAHDDAMTERGLMSNERALNTLQTANMQIKLDFASPVSSTAYAVLGTESLTYVI